MTDQGHYHISKDFLRVMFVAIEVTDVQYFLSLIDDILNFVVVFEPRLLKFGIPIYEEHKGIICNEFCEAILVVLESIGRRRRE